MAQAPPGPQIHPTALVAETATVGDGTRIGPFAIIEDQVTLGCNNRVGAHSVIKPYTRMGDENHLSEHVVIGGDPQDVKFEGGRSSVHIGHRNRFREYVTVNRATESDGSTRIGDENFFMACSHVAHECVIGDQVVMANGVLLAGHVTIDDQAFLSGGVVVHQFTRIGTLAMIGGNAKVIQDILPFFLADGIPARFRGLNLVGLRRQACPREQLTALKKAYRIVAQKSGGKREKVRLLRALQTPWTDHLADFIHGSSRGFARFC